MTVSHLAASGAAGGPMATYLLALRQGRFVIQRCSACGRFVFQPRTLCPGCGGELDWAEPSGLGTVHAVTVVARRPEQGGPYNVVLVDLDEGVRMMSRVEMPADQVRIGQRVHSMIVTEKGEPLLVFRPTGGGGDGGR